MEDLIEIELEVPLYETVDVQAEAIDKKEICVETKTQNAVDHEKTYNREKPNQHPMSAITGLVEELETEENEREQADAALGLRIDGKQDEIADLNTIRSNASAGKSASDTIASYGDIVTHNASEFATAEQGEKADSAVQPGVMNSAISAHNTSDLSHEDIRAVADEALTRASDKAISKVFDTTAEMDTWLKDTTNKGVLKVGDNIYIIDPTVPDYWVSAVYETADPTTGYYYRINKLSSEVPDITNMVTTNTAQTITGNKNFTGNLQKGGSNVLSVSDIVNNLHSTETDKALSAKQGRELSNYMDDVENSLSDRIDGVEYGVSIEMNELEERIKQQLNKQVYTFDVLPITQQKYLNIPIQYKGTTNSNYTYGYFYKFTDPVYTSSVNVQTGSFTVTVNGSVFCSNFESGLSHTFTRKRKDGYGAYYWEINGERIFDAYLSDYGLSISGDSNVNDVFVVNVTMNTTVSRIDVQPTGTSSLATLTDVSLSSPANGQFLSYNGTNWTNTTLNALQNTATGARSLTILGTPTTKSESVNIGIGSNLNSGGYGNVAIGYGSIVQSNASYATAIGRNAKAQADGSIALGNGCRTTIPNTFCVAVGGWNETSYMMMDSYGKIPEDRITKQTTLSSSSTDNQVPSAKCVYDLVGNVEALINAL